MAAQHEFNLHLDIGYRKKFLFGGAIQVKCRLSVPGSGGLFHGQTYGDHIFYIRGKDNIGYWSDHKEIKEQVLEAIEEILSNPPFSFLGQGTFTYKICKIRSNILGNLPDNDKIDAERFAKEIEGMQGKEYKFVSWYVEHKKKHGTY
jgi:hypothetical protein